ncbi:MAG: phosphohydrolase [Christensenellales bacterium]
MEESSIFIRTFSGIRMDPYNIKPGEVFIEDIAHALSMMVRANGHIKVFYSIAQHSINCALEANNRGFQNRVQLACLMHDAAECYIADVPRPVKYRLKGYDEIERHVTDIVFASFGIDNLTETELEMVKQIDDAMLYYEFKALANTRISEVIPDISMQHDFAQRRIEDVKGHFLSEFRRLHGK